MVCAGIVPDPLQTLEPVQTPDGPGLKNIMMLPAVLDPWAAHALYEAAHLAQKIQGSKVWLVTLAPKAKLQQVMMTVAQKIQGSKVWLVTLAPKAKLQQVMMTVAQKAQFELVPVDCAENGFSDPYECAVALADTIKAIPAIEFNRLFIFGGWESASRGSGVTLQVIGERLGIFNQFQGVDELKINTDGTFEVYERIEEGKHQISRFNKLPAILGWATGNLPEPKNNPQVGMLNMRTIMPALQKAKQVKFTNKNLVFDSVQLPKQERNTRIVKDTPVEVIARELLEWINQ